MKPCIRQLILATVLLLSIKPLYAACTFTAPAGSDFGSPTSFAVAEWNAPSITYQTGFSCTGGLLAVLGNNSVTASFALSANQLDTSRPRMSNNAPNNTRYIPYILCMESGCTTPYTNDTPFRWSGSVLLGLLGIIGVDGSIPFYLRMQAASNLPAGLYTDTITINWTYSICQIGIGPICISSSGSGVTTLNVRVNVQNDCLIKDAPNISFGTMALPAQFQTVSSTINLSCTNAVPYSVTMISTNPVIGNWRQMSALVNGATHNMQYQLIKPNEVPWNPQDTYQNIGTGGAQIINYKARVNPDQPNLPAGSYKDTVTVTVTY